MKNGDIRSYFSLEKPEVKKMLSDHREGNTYTPKQDEKFEDCPRRLNYQSGDPPKNYEVARSHLPPNLSECQDSHYSTT